MPAAFLSRLRRFLSAPAVPGGSHPFREQPRRFATAQTVIRAFYAYLLYYAVSQFTMVGDFTNHHLYAPLWPVAWLPWFHGLAGVHLVLAVYFATNVLGVFFVGLRSVRLAVFLGLLEIVALRNSFGKIGHSLHLLVLLAGLLVLLPAGWTRPAILAPRRLRQETLLVCWLAQTAILLSYTMSGLGKLGGGLYQTALGQRSVFLPGALGAHIAQRLGQTSSRSPLGDWIIHHPYLTWPLFPAAVVFETGAILAAFRPALGRPVAAFLILFHVGTYWTMTITFPQNCLLLALFFLASPFEGSDPRWQTMLFSVPFAHKIWLRWQSTRTAAGE